MAVLIRSFCIILFAVHWVFPASAGEVPAKRRVMIIITDNCPRCDRELDRLKAPGGTFETLRRTGWKIGDSAEDHIQIAHADQLHEQIKTWGIKMLPAVICVRGNEIERTFKDGCGTPLDPHTFGWLIKGVDERKTPVKAEPVTVKTTGHYPLRGNHWNVEGDWFPGREKVLAHLRSAVHVDLIPSRFKLESWSEEELLALHDDLHESSAPQTGATRTIGSQSNVRMSQSMQQQTQQTHGGSAVKPSVQALPSNSSYSNRRF